MSSNNITTIKITKQTKERLNKLKSHKRETYEDLIQDILNILNLCKINPEKARLKLKLLDKVHKRIDDVR